VNMLTYFVMPYRRISQRTLLLSQMICYYLLYFITVRTHKVKIFSVLQLLKINLFQGRLSKNWNVL
jgi:hypothetical protein